MDAIPDIDKTLADTYRDIREKGGFGGDFGDLPAADPDQSTAPAGEQVAGEIDAGAESQVNGDAGAQAAEGEHVDGAEDEAGEQSQQVDPDAPKFRPPWKKAALADYDKLPDTVRAEIERREGDFHKGIEQYKGGAAQAQDWDRAVQPYMATIQGFGVTPQVAVGELLKADHTLRYSATPQKVNYLLKIAGDYGVDIGTLAQGIQQIAGEQVWQQQNPVDPRLHQLQQQVGQLTHHITQQNQQAATRETSAIDGEIAAFAADPDHEHFGALQQDMAAFLQTGRAKTLDDAYEMAMRANPQTAPIWFAQQQQKQEDERRAKVAGAKKSQANNVRPNGRTSGAQTQVAQTMEQTIEAEARRLGIIN